ncbi:hypothetical protein DUZ99_14620 [Xylanibacillus composti]|uniref:Hint domain-containing protein n=1 Tax=Xylanibacillus composti TaxID=1572762 RepID=A0A8J4M224_9BACL|nr:Hint domain-containing protein [Xylanibacillus composti]MDT9726212.1 hypothetical protein [Xylanibacillus composti]GIQ68061.1 hypothetical protein XYCOK13_08850 [Xylanibacillus composti]
MAIRKVSEMPVLDQQYKADLKVIIDKAQRSADGALALNMANDEDYRLVKSHYDFLGITPQRYPQLSLQLQMAREAGVRGKDLAVKYDQGTDGFTDANLINNLAIDLMGRAVAQGLSTYIGGAYSVILTLQLFDKDNQDLLASENIHVMGEGEFTPIQAKSDKGAPERMQAALFVAYTKTVNSPTEHLVVTREIDKGPVADPEITQPVPKDPNAKVITIGLSRGVGNRDNVDYWFNQQLWDDKTVMVPLAGKVTFQSPIIQPLVPKQNIYINLAVAMATGGLKVDPEDVENQVYPYFTVDPSDPCTLLFNKPAPTDPKSTDNGNPIVFGKAPWSTDTIVYFYCNISIKTQNSGTFFVNANIQSSDFPDWDPLDGTLYIRPFNFTWHCLAKGSRITLADGREAAIEELSGGEEVLVSANGDKLAVGATYVGKHDGPAYKLVTENGEELTLSDCHVVGTPDGFKLAMELKAGDQVMTREGAARLASVEEVDYDGYMINLELAAPEEYGDTTMFANGIWVGDKAMQSRYFRTHYRSHELVLHRLPQDFHKDFESLLEDIAAAR